jgi:FtsZ-binding cell division protein ZapB
MDFSPAFLNKSTLGFNPNTEFREKIVFIFKQQELAHEMPWPDFVRYMLDKLEDKAVMTRSEREKYEVKISDLQAEIERLTVLNDELNSANQTLTQNSEGLSSKVAQLKLENEQLKQATPSTEMVQHTESKTAVIVESTPANIYVLREWCKKKEKTPGQILIDEMFITFAKHGLCDVDHPTLNPRAYNQLCQQLNK